ncbi:uncharacterized protein LOC128882448 [Hylaeus volcanicus]|uniref:uncharacterized protein LOC128882448 n=1 Tax=Hylaeus volcanicus TaxID=313075 RepID=UPI0023B7E56E|nr:uncharacterized protein LOC128882448 [Hylaeus volcanicus]
MTTSQKEDTALQDLSARPSTQRRPEARGPNQQPAEAPASPPRRPGTPPTHVGPSLHRPHTAASWDMTNSSELVRTYFRPNSQSNTEIDECLLDMEKHIKTSMEKTIPKSRSTNSIDKYINNRITSLRRDKSFLVTLVTRRRSTFNQEQRQCIKIIIKSIKYLLAKEFSKAVNRFWAQKAKEIDHTKSDKFFTIINQMFRRKNGIIIEDLTLNDHHTAIVSRVGATNELIHGTNGSYLVENTQAKIEILGAHFEEINAPIYLNEGTRLKEIVDRTTEEFRMQIHPRHRVTEFSQENPASCPTRINVEDDIELFTNRLQVQTICKKLPNKTSTGPDDMPEIVIKHLPPIIIRTYTAIFNNALNNGYFPTAWKKTKIIPIQKKDRENRSPGNYRSINLALNISKVYEIIIKQALERSCKKNNIIADNQFGFKYRHSTLHAVEKLMSDIYKYLNNKDIVTACLIEIEKAFDTV